MSLSDVVQLTITTQTVFPTRLGFGVPLIMVLHTVTTNLLDEYASLTEMTDAGWSTSSPGYKAVQKVFSQNPRPPKVVIGKRTRSYTQTIRLTPVKTTVGYHYKFNVVDPAGVVTAIDFTVVTGTVAAIVTALTALIDPVTDVTATDDTTHITVAAAAGKVFDLTELPPMADMLVQDMTVDPGLDDDLADVFAQDEETWYGILADRAGEAEINGAAAWIETVRKLALFNTSDSIVASSSTTDVGSDLKAASYARTGLLFYGKSLQSYSAHAWMGKVLPTEPGKTTWAYQTLAGITIDKLKSGEKTFLKNKNVSYYVAIGGQGSTFGGKTAVGEFLDVTHFVDMLYARIQERVFATIKQASDAGRKIPYTDGGVDTIRTAIMAVLEQNKTRQGDERGLAADPPATVSAPKVADVDPALRAARIVPDITFQATLAGAIHQVQIAGTLSV